MQGHPCRVLLTPPQSVVSVPGACSTLLICHMQPGATAQGEKPLISPICPLCPFRFCKVTGHLPFFQASASPGIQRLPEKNITFSCHSDPSPAGPSPLGTYPSPTVTYFSAQPIREGKLVNLFPLFYLLTVEI
jgi:hypothetical protein